MENLPFIVLAFAGFVIIQTVVDSYHDHFIREADNAYDMVNKTANNLKRLKHASDGQKRDLNFAIAEWKVKAKNYNKLWHRLDAFNKGLSWAVLAVAVTLGFSLEWWWMIILTVFAMPIRWNIFDPVYNILRKQKLLYIGTVSDTDSISNSPYLILGIKLAWLGLMIGLMFWA